MSKEFMRKYPKSRTCQYCGGDFSNKGIKQHQNRCGLSHFISKRLLQLESHIGFEMMRTRAAIKYRKPVADIHEAMAFDVRQIQSIFDDFESSAKVLMKDLMDVKRPLWIGTEPNETEV